MLNGQKSGFLVFFGPYRVLSLESTPEVLLGAAEGRREKSLKPFYQISISFIFRLTIAKWGKTSHLDIGKLSPQI